MAAAHAAGTTLERIAEIVGMSRQRCWSSSGAKQARTT
jgi:hypothetical protein